ncbi:MAG: NADH-quinone oxidoreductase subunit J [Ardenticatenaceae bacterium]|nr:NADH-quinone oxidoreductase subunit J [Anaerolineales bacterium]MCB8920801.1 NADH-quinone oxidoreductase subunit J [Ardenticatenaceae bacterium]MCB8989760.1 NADH-quinone oxidoreductase subunit J [Ardenticatenaceae bacterium]MCB9002781.1 NADH-quinone oxidoreductase subunit J [Ardenticatenaceae bacterium]
MGSPILFFILAFIAVLSALGMLLSRNAIYSALFLVLNFVTIAILYLVLNAPFIAMVQITVYAGAIMVLFLFVIMLLGAERLGGVASSRDWEWATAGILGGVLLLVFMLELVLKPGGGTTELAATFIDTSPAALGMRLFEAYVFPFELTGVLLLAAMIGVVVLGRTKKRGKDV